MQKILNNTQVNSHALGAKLNRGLERQLLEETANWVGGLVLKFLKRIDIKPSEECWQWTGTLQRTGYGIFCYKKRRIIASRVSYIIFNQKLIPDGMFVCHSCDNKSCVNPKHLWVGTNKDNQMDAARKLISISPDQKLTHEQVREMRALMDLGIKDKELSKKYGVTYEHVNNIRHRKCWKYL